MALLLPLEVVPHIKRMKEKKADFHWSTAMNSHGSFTFTLHGDLKHRQSKTEVKFLWDGPDKITQSMIPHEDEDSSALSSIMTSSATVITDMTDLNENTEINNLHNVHDATHKITISDIVVPNPNMDLSHCGKENTCMPKERNDAALHDPITSKDDTERMSNDENTTVIKLPEDILTTCGDQTGSEEKNNTHPGLKQETKDQTAAHSPTHTDDIKRAGDAQNATLKNLPEDLLTTDACDIGRNQTGMEHKNDTYKEIKHDTTKQAASHYNKTTRPPAIILSSEPSPRMPSPQLPTSIHNDCDEKYSALEIDQETGEPYPMQKKQNEAEQPHVCDYVAKTISDDVNTQLPSSTSKDSYTSGLGESITSDSSINIAIQALQDNHNQDAKVKVMNVEVNTEKSHDSGCNPVSIPDDNSTHLPNDKVSSDNITNNLSVTMPTNSSTIHETSTLLATDKNQSNTVANNLSVAQPSDTAINANIQETTNNLSTFDGRKVKKTFLKNEFADEECASIITDNKCAHDATGSSSSNTPIISSSGLIQLPAMQSCNNNTECNKNDFDNNASSKSANITCHNIRHSTGTSEVKENNIQSKILINEKGITRKLNESISKQDEHASLKQQHDHQETNDPKKQNEHQDKTNNAPNIFKTSSLSEKCAMKLRENIISISGHEKAKTIQTITHDADCININTQQICEPSITHKIPTNEKKKESIQCEDAEKICLLFSEEESKETNRVTGKNIKANYDIKNEHMTYSEAEDYLNAQLIKHQYMSLKIRRKMEILQIDRKCRKSSAVHQRGDSQTAHYLNDDRLRGKRTHTRVMKKHEDATTFSSDMYDYKSPMESARSTEPEQPAIDMEDIHDSCCTQGQSYKGMPGLIRGTHESASPDDYKTRGRGWVKSRK